MKMETPNADKLVARTDEWNAIYSFIEWLQEKKIWLAHTITYREYYGDHEWGYKDEPMDTMVPIPQNIESLLYEYFNVNPSELERERRATLDSIREGNVSFTRVK